MASCVPFVFEFEFDEMGYALFQTCMLCNFLLNGLNFRKTIVLPEEHGDDVWEWSGQSAVEPHQWPTYMKCLHQLVYLTSFNSLFSTTWQIIDNFTSVATQEAIIGVAWQFLAPVVLTIYGPWTWQGLSCFGQKNAFGVKSKTRCCSPHCSKVITWSWWFATAILWKQPCQMELIELLVTQSSSQSSTEQLIHCSMSPKPCPADSKFVECNASFSRLYQAHLA